MSISKRLSNLPPYLFAELDRLSGEKRQQGVDVISLGIGDPDLPTCHEVIEVMEKEIKKPEHHDYPPYDGTAEFKKAVADFYYKRYNTVLDPQKEVLTLIGSKEGISHIYWALTDPGDVSLIPDPGYPVYNTGALFTGVEPFIMPLIKENGFLPDLTRIPPDIAKRASVMFLNYPNNPTSAVATVDFYKEVIQFAKKYEIAVLSDNSYHEIYFNEPPISILSLEGAKDVCAEFFSLSKPFNMTGWRIGAFVGNRDLVNALGIIKKNIDSGTFTAIQTASAYALNHCGYFVEEMRKVYRRRRDKVVESLKGIGIPVDSPSATFYIWAPTPNGEKSMDFCGRLLNETGVVVTPGTGFGIYGEGFFRISLTCPDHRLDEAVKRIASLKVRVG